MVLLSVRAYNSVKEDFMDCVMVSNLALIAPFAFGGLAGLITSAVLRARGYEPKDHRVNRQTFVSVPT